MLIPNYLTSYVSIRDIPPSTQHHLLNLLLLHLIHESIMDFALLAPHFYALLHSDRRAHNLQEHPQGFLFLGTNGPGHARGFEERYICFVAVEKIMLAWREKGETGNGKWLTKLQNRQFAMPCISSHTQLRLWISLLVYSELATIPLAYSCLSFVWRDNGLSLPIPALALQ